MRNIKEEQMDHWIEIFCVLDLEFIWRADKEPDKNISLDPFTMSDVEEFIALSPGNCCDEELRDSIGILKLRDERYVAIVNAEILNENCESGCVPDEWGAAALVAHSKKALIASLSSGERQRLCLG